MECPKCGAELIIKQGKHGAFLGCSTFPKCNGSRSAKSEGLSFMNRLRLEEFFRGIEIEMAEKHGFEYDDDYDSLGY